MKMEKAFTLVQTVAVAPVFSAVSCWYLLSLTSRNSILFRFGRESARKELGSLIQDLRRQNPNS
ncbi:hypothetical protein RchiOBHm_Chr7g0205921 [Rosa chinensis]|uniref:Uncharacterized protein n=1 Tax=Rosa chinensis TaxID=74649 RepID=A0A2P6P926_ROSCH|nr:hypothetical protein RchiOBHm_Chr7g0205921 [Rosa chinensis]